MRRLPLPKPSGRLTAFVVVCAVVFIGLYAAVVVLYAQGGKSDAGTGIDNRKPGLHVVLTPREIDAAGDRIRFDLTVDAGDTGLLSSDGATVVRPFQLELAGAETRSLVFEEGQTFAPATVWMRTTGAIEQWPFDMHAARSLVVAVTGPTGAEQTPVSVDLGFAEHHIPGWAITVADEGVRGVVLADGAEIHQYTIQAHRASATIAFGMVLLALMVIMPTLGLTVAIMALRGRRRVEVGFFTWNAGMLFATPMLRNFLPGQPPIGSWVDYLVVLWVIAGLILALLISVVAWYRWGEPQSALSRQEPAALDPPRPTPEAQSGPPTDGSPPAIIGAG